MANSAIIVLLKEYINLLNTEGISVSKAFLFGSHASGATSDASDIDIMIVSDKYDETDDFAAGKIWSLTRKVNTKIEPFLISLDRFKNDQSSPLLSLIKEKGVEII